VTIPRLALGLAALAFAASACSATVSGTAAPSPSQIPEAASSADDWETVLADAAGTTVRWWLYGGDDRVNRYIDEHVVPVAADLGVDLQRVPIADTADAVQRVVAEVQAGEDNGAVDLIWINGENFALGKGAGLWLQDWATTLPNAALVDPATVATDFGVTVEGQESPWSRALFVYAHDTERVPDPPRTLDDLLTFAEANPGRVTYPAPPDFTGSAFVRQVVAALGEDDGFDYLRRLQPFLWQEGRTHPASEAELNRLFGDGQVDVAMSYDPGFVETSVRQGLFPESARPFVLEHGTLHNVSFVTIPNNAGNRAGAMVVANLLLDPTLQGLKADPEVLGVPTVLDLDALGPADRARFERVTASPWLLAEYGDLVAELPVEHVETLEQRWREEVLP